MIDRKVMQQNYLQIHWARWTNYIFFNM